MQNDVCLVQEKRLILANTFIASDVKDLQSRVINKFGNLYDIVRQKISALSVQALSIFQKDVFRVLYL